MGFSKKERQVKFIVIAIIFFLTGMAVRHFREDLFIVYDYLLIASLYYTAIFILNPKNALMTASLIFLMLGVCVIYIAWPVIRSGILFFTVGKMPVYGYSAFKYIPVRLHVLLAAVWSSSIIVCLFNQRPVRLTSAALFAAMHLLVFSAFDSNINEVEYVIDIPSISVEAQPLVIAHISDLHSSIFPEGRKGLIEKIKSKNPDIILLTGDIADDYSDFRGTEIFLEGIQDTAPIYYATGNHEYWDKNYFEINEKIKSYGVTHLSDAYEIIEIKGTKIMLGGIDDPDKFMRYPQAESFDNRFETLNSSLDFDGPKILLSHRPEKAALYSSGKFDIILSGHAHGGQVRIPYLVNGLYAPNQGRFPKYAGGKYELAEDKYMIVSRGLYIDSLPRIFNPPELVWVVLE